MVSPTNAVYLLCMHRFGVGLIAIVSLLAFSSAAFAQRDLGPPVEEACPLTEADRGQTIRRLFTASDGTQMSFSLEIPPDYDPGQPRGVALYLHGNDDDQGGNFYPLMLRNPTNAAAHGLVPAVILSPDTRPSDDGTSTVREWKYGRDDLVIEELLLSDFGGCLPLNRDQVVISGESAGTCVASRLLTTVLWKNFAGGVLGYCGCWPPQSEYLYLFDQEELRNRFRVFIQSTTGGFEYWNGPNGYEHFHYNLGLDVRTDLLRAGGHCEDSRINGEAALDWVLGYADYPAEFAFEPFWQQVDLTPNYLDSLIAINPSGLAVKIQREDDLSEDDWALIKDQLLHLEGRELAPFYEWRDATFPQFEDLPVRVSVSSDYGETWSVGQPLEGLVYDLIALADGQFLIATNMGVLRDDGTGLNYTPFTLSGENVHALVQDEAGTLYAYAPLLGTLRRSNDGGMMWEELANAPVPTGYLARERHVLQYHGGVLTLVQSDDTVLYSDDGGDSWSQATLPARPGDFAHYGTTFYFVDQMGTGLSRSANAGETWEPITAVGDSIWPTLNVTPAGDLMIQGADAAFRSSDGGLTFQRDPGLVTLRNADVAFGPNDTALAIGLRGIFRYQTDPSALPENPGLLVEGQRPGAEPAVDEPPEDAPPNANMPPDAPPNGDPTMAPTAPVPGESDPMAPSPTASSTSSDGGCSILASRMGSSGIAGWLAVAMMVAWRRRAIANAANSRHEPTLLPAANCVGVVRNCHSRFFAARDCTCPRTRQGRPPA